MLEQRLSNPTEFGQLKKIFLDARKRGQVIQHKNKRKTHSNDEIKAQIQLVTDKFLHTRFKNVDSDGHKKASFKVDEANTKAQAKDVLKILVRRMNLWVLRLWKK